MRTRLDEIIEFEARASGFGSWNTESSDLTTLPATVKRIAERAFRHGVDRTMETFIPEIAAGVKIPFVQPAPTEEKKAAVPGSHHTYYRENWWCCDMAYPGTTLVPAPKGGFYPCGCRNDRRKGERRKRPGDRRFEHPLVGLFDDGLNGTVPLRYHKASVRWLRCRRNGNNFSDRRSGRDRRKA